MPLERPVPADEPPAPPEFWRGPLRPGGENRGGTTPARSQLLRRFALLVATLALLWLLVMLVGGDSGALAIFRAGNRLSELEGQVRALEAENARLRAEIQSLERDDVAIERVAREELMMARPDEEVILVPDPRSLPVPSPSPGSKGASGRR